MSDNLPPNLVPNILARLPLKTVLRCTSVCKSWYSLITSPSFISSHLNLSLSNHESRLLLRFCTKDSDIVKEHYSVRRDNQTFDEIDKLYCPFTTSNGYFSNRYFTIVGSFNGLLCLTDNATSYERIILWNPSLRKSLLLPEPRLIYELSHGFNQYAIGFGFLSSTNVYKVVRVVCHILHVEDDDIGISPPVAQIYELGTSSWRNSDAGDCSYAIFERTSQAFLKDSVHWMAFNQSAIKLVVSFDMITEKFGAFMIPDTLQSEWPLSVSTFRESLCLIHHPDITQIPRTIDFCSIWVMKEYGVTDSWEKQFNIDIGHHSLLRPLCFRENGDILLSTCLRLVAYDPKNNQFKNLGEWEDTPPRSLYVDNYVESLVLIKGSNEALSYPSLLCKDNEVKGCGGIGKSNRWRQI